VRIEHLENLPNLIFLDMYNNKLITLDGPVSCARGLRVLMAGKNRLTSITNLTTLKKLDVLDLHSNEIKNISGVLCDVM
jgi:leucine-rich repeat-containing protein 49